ncbi:uncharacterized WD repeat-containing protein alr2800 isoform X2 [Dioscorea cayenensis subsp. rotundata]|uniref:Uncharacterized WD repeat-containing protein alr2800 isoform X2 n=1 Tax=Dioscorea cayennensis subsp. rotundata TaxID=55577 RepID=A0AB40B3V2_DIOCR|nr:uncharacterized WD repeat-containing protein alr2800 isoform X2 [Dioscorea cayenensis subsp. rotundata]
MSQPLSLLPPNPNPNPNPNPDPSPSTSQPPPPPLQWRDLAVSWLSSHSTPPTATDLDSWIESNLHSLPESLRSLPRPELHRRIISLFNPAPTQVSNPSPSDPLHPYRFQRTDQWMPVYSWLESLDADSLVDSKEIMAWLESNRKVYDMLLLKHSKYHLMHYIQRLHLKVLKKKGKVPKGVQLSTARASVKIASGKLTTDAVPLQCKSPSNVMKDKEMFLNKKSEAFFRYELLTDLQNQLTRVLSKNKHATNLRNSPSLPLSKQPLKDNSGCQPSMVDKNAKFKSGETPNFLDAISIQVTEQLRPGSLLETVGGQKRKREPAIAIPAWSSSEAIFGTFRGDQPLSSHYGEVGTHDISRKNAQVSLAQKYSDRRNIATCLQGREIGFRGYDARNHGNWSSFLKGWRSLGRQFDGPAVWFERRSYSSWVPTWCAYTSNVAVAQTLGRQGVQKVLDVRFHPEGLPQLVCSCNEAPNELLLYNLLSGRATQLSGHNCQIQAVEFAVRGASVVSCGANLLKVWDCITGSCLFTLGSVGVDRSLVGHSKKIHAMTVNTWQSCLVATSGGIGDDKLLLWNALRGELAADLNMNLRAKDQCLPSIDAMEFCGEHLLVCGSDCAYNGPALVQLWDLGSPNSCVSFPAHDSFITSLKINSACNTIITGAGDGTIGLFDIRSCDAIGYLSVGSGYEITSASFSSCGTYFNASSTSNNTIVWDTRLMPMNRGQMPIEMSHRGSGMHYMRPLHCLSHGNQMPTAENSGQLPGHVDEGDQGVNDARWLNKEPILVTVSGDGCLAMWDVTLGKPCVRHIISHARCANTVAVSGNDEYLCSGGDDQKIVLYHNEKARARQNWRLSHPIIEKN